MKSRALTVAALAASVMIGATGCGAITPVGTAIPYSPSDGVTVASAMTNGPLRILNTFVVAGDDAREGNLVAAVVNSTDETQVLNLEWGSAGVAAVEIGPRETVSFGSEDYEPIPLENLGAAPGDTISIYFQAGQTEGVATEVPVLDGCLEYYAHLTPGGVPSDCEKPESVSSH